jgi:hypothetical protein
MSTVKITQTGFQLYGYLFRTALVGRVDKGGLAPYCLFSKGFFMKEKFDVNENVHYDWIPAIKLWSD